jgi:hypothetical protein
MATWSTLHIFGYGETQLIGTDSNKKVPSTALTTLDAVVNNVYSFKPEGNEATEEYHAINIFNNMFADWQPKAPEAKGWRTEYADLDAEAIAALVAEVEAYVAPEPEVVAPIAE